MNMRKIGWPSVALAALLLMATPGASRAQAGAPPQALPPQASQAPPAYANDFGSGGWLGVSISEVNADTVKQFKLPEEAGALVANVAENTPAAKAGLRKNDVVTEYDGMKIQGVAGLSRLVRETPPGRQAQITVWRDGHTEKLNAQIGQAPAQPPAGPEVDAFYGPGPNPDFRFAPGFGPGGHGYGPVPQGPSGPPQGPEGNYGPGGPGPGPGSVPGSFGRGNFAYGGATPTLGIAAENLSGQLGEYFGAPNDEGVLVTEVQQGPGATAGLKAGDVIVKIGNDAIRNLGELRDHLRQSPAGASITLGILRKGMEMSLTATPQPPQGINPGGPRRQAQ